MAKTTTFSFTLNSKQILNSNSMPSHFILKGKLVATLRELAASQVALEHPEKAQEEVYRKLDYLRAINDEIIQKKRVKKRLEKADYSKEEIAEKLLAEFPLEEKEEFSIEPLFNHFTMMVKVYPPTRRRLDPPNLWPTVKALTDGATDASAWVDDDFEHLLETSFRYGGLSGQKDIWKIELVITEVDNLEDFQLEAEVPN